MLQRTSLRLGLCALLTLILPHQAPALETAAIAVIVPVGNAGTGPDRQDLALIFKRKKRFWPDGQRIHPANLPADHPVRRAFSAQILGHAPEELDDYWRDMYFHGELPPFVAQSEEAVIRFVTATPGAIGYVSACLADQRVKVVMVLPEGARCGR